MLIRCTKKLQDQLKIKPAGAEEADPFYSWHANVLFIERRKTVVLVNDKNRYTIVLYGLKAKDFAKLEEHIIAAIRATFKADGIKEDVIEKYLEKAGAVNFAKTKDRASVARMNKSCDNVQFFGRELHPEVLYNTEVSMRISRSLVGSGNGDYSCPNEELFNDLEKLAGETIFQSEAAVLKVKLELEGHQVWRRLVVPLNYTFTKLHEILQIAFNWKGYHLHEFYIYDDTESMRRPVVNLVSDEEAFAYPDDIAMKHEKGVKLSEYIPSHRYLKYIYDFGDDWSHSILVEEVIDNYDRNVPVCLEGEGNAPPEDCGGESGYDEFLEIMADEQHPDHESMSQWGRVQGYRNFDLSVINRRLNYL
ncbi:plasmid pRiA4b ORF-3 family protein [Siminovitchia fortis]|uniref:plasmid pRiA4b ORF-3 family protein n=1 Tax=Siminovitchia fortis TaxID=254758 RepID=UPI0011A42165|nr:plasmid pRiA4b ORF-3 family protein [Siminovitchia fortis]